jgi:hypothetical protein
VGLPLAEHDQGGRVTLPKAIEQLMPQTAEALSNALDVCIASAVRCYICERRLGTSWVIITNKRMNEGTGMYDPLLKHRCHYTCALEWMQRHAKD